MNDLFDAGLWLTRVGPETFLVNVRNRSVFLSPDGWAATSLLSDDPSTGCCEVNACVSWLAVLLEDALFTANKQSPLLVPEFGSELLLMMKEDANRMWYAILNHVCLVPIQNRRELCLRLYDQLVELVLDRSPAEYTAILNELVFPVDWHNLVTPERNRFAPIVCFPFSPFPPSSFQSISTYVLLEVHSSRSVLTCCSVLCCSILFTLYRGSVYDSTADTKEEQAEHFGRFVRNSSTHVLKALGMGIGRTDISLLHHSLAPLYFASLERALQRRGWLVSTEIHTLFAQGR